MSEPIDVKLSDLAPHPIDGLAGLVRDHIEKQPNMGLAAIAWDLVGSGANRALDEALHEDLFEHLAGAWVAIRELEEFTDETKHPRNRTEITHLGKHAFHLTFRPVLQITIAGQPAPPLALALDLAAEFQSVALSIRNGCIIAISPGECSLSAQLRCGHVDLDKPKVLSKVHLPGRMSLHPELALPGAQSHADH